MAQIFNTHYASDFSLECWLILMAEIRKKEKSLNAEISDFSIRKHGPRISVIKSGSLPDARMQWILICTNCNDATLRTLRSPTIKFLCLGLSTPLTPHDVSFMDGLRRMRPHERQSRFTTNICAIIRTMRSSWTIDQKRSVLASKA